MRAAGAVVRAVVAIVHERRLMLMAASLAYFAFVSLVPLLLLVVIGLSALQDGRIALDVATYAADVISPRSGGVLIEVVTNATDRESVTVIGVVVLLWGTLLLFRALDDAFGQVYGDHQDSLLLGDLTDALLVFFVVLGAMVAMLGLSVAFSIVLQQRVWGLLGPVVLLIVLSGVFFPMFYLFPDADVSLAQALPGTVFTAAGWTVLQVVYAFYARTAGAGELYGAAGAFLLLLAWLYIGGLVLLIGAVLNAVLADHVVTDGDLSSLEYV